MRQGRGSDQRCSDEPIDVLPLQSVLPGKLDETVPGGESFEFLPESKLLRKANNETAFAGTDLAKIRWQDVWYPIGTAMGLRQYVL